MFVTFPSPVLGSKIPRSRSGRCITRGKLANRKMIAKGNLWLGFVHTEWKMFNGILCNSFMSLNKFITSFKFVPEMDTSSHRQLLIEM